MNELTGNIEILSDSNIFKVTLPSGKKEVVLKKNKDYLISSFNTSPANKKRVISTTGSIDDPTRLVFYSENKGFETILKEVFVGFPSFAHDGKSIAYLKRDYNSNNWIDDWYLYLMNSDGSFDKQLTTLSLSNYRPSWFPDGKRLAVTKKNLSIYVVDMISRDEKKIVEYGVAPTVSNNGRFIAYLAKEIDTAKRKSIKDYMQLTVKEYNDAKKENGTKNKEMLEIESSFFRNAIYIYDVELGKSRKLTEILSIEAPVIWSPNDEFLLFNDERSLGHELYTLKIKTGEIEKLSGVNGEIMFWGE
jgi:Tol biopolymer transport system component